MKMAKASQEDLDAAMKVSGRLEDLGRGQMPYMGDESEDLEFFDRDDEEQCKRALHSVLDAADRGNMFRVIFGMVVVGDPRNKVIDPDADTLEVHPEHVANAISVVTLTARVAELEAQNGNLQAEVDSVKEHSQDRERCLEAALKPFAISPHADLHDSSDYTYRSAKVADYRRAAALLAKEK